MTALAQMLLSDRVPQCLLFKQGTFEDAIAFSKRLFGSEHEGKITSGNHPDLHLILPEEKSDLHPMATIQKLIREVALPPYESKVKLFLLIDAEKMLPSASNALLKTLEEPPEDTYFLLLSNHPDRLLPTIVSRLRPVSFQGEEIPSIDLSPYLEMARNEEWDTLLDTLSALEQENPQSVFKACLESISDPAPFQKMSHIIAEGQTALEHHVKPKTVYLQMLLKMAKVC